MFGPKFNGTKLKVNLKLCITRLQMLQRKKENQGVLSRKDIAKLLEKGKQELARIRVEQIIREDVLIEVLEILELYCSLLVSRFGLVESVRDCDPGIKEAAATLLWCTPHLESEVKELKAISHFLIVRYGKEFVREIMEEAAKARAAGPDSFPSPNRTNWVSERVIVKLTTHRYEDRLVDSYLVAIAQSFGVVYNPPVRPMEADLLGGSVPTAPSILDFPDAPSADGHSSNGGHGGAGGGSGGGGLDLLLPSPPGAPSTSYNSGGGGGGGVAALFPPAGGSGGTYPPNSAQYPPEPLSQPAYPPQQTQLYPPQQQQQPQQQQYQQPPTQQPQYSEIPDLPTPPQTQEKQPNGTLQMDPLSLSFSQPCHDSNDAPPSFEESMRSSIPAGGLPFAPANTAPPPQAANGNGSGPQTPTTPMLDLPSPPKDNNDINASISNQPPGGSVEPDFEELTRRFKELRQKSSDDK